MILHTARRRISRHLIEAGRILIATRLNRTYIPAAQVLLHIAITCGGDTAIIPIILMQGRTKFPLNHNRTETRIHVIRHRGHPCLGQNLRTDFKTLVIKALLIK